VVQKPRFEVALEQQRHLLVLGGVHHPAPKVGQRQRHAILAYYGPSALAATTTISTTAAAATATTTTAAATTATNPTSTAELSLPLLLLAPVGHFAAAAAAATVAAAVAMPGDTAMVNQGRSLLLGCDCSC
jgi:hypothetical protein